MVFKELDSIRTNKGVQNIPLFSTTKSVVSKTSSG